MSWAGRLLGRDRRHKTTAVGVAATLAEVVIQGTNGLQARLAEQGLGWTAPDWTSSDEFLLECAVFEWFLRDIVVSRQFGRRATSVRQALEGRVLIDLQRSGLSAACVARFEGCCRERFVEYAEALAVSASLQPLGAAAWRRISGGGRPSERMTMLLAGRAAAELARLRSFDQSYRLVGMAAPSLPHPRQP